MVRKSIGTIRCWVRFSQKGFRDLLDRYDRVVPLTTRKYSSDRQ
ncbi:hypothetical protein HanRHA438_Chr16g0785021 [Helianthus annuus]|nr:hypothetical protein HanRHA438_Chr16g0785021 [Helianthus annuus]